LSKGEIVEQVFELLEASYDAREQELGAAAMRQIERIVLLRSIDNRWVRHLTALDELREGIGLRAVGQRNPLVEYKREAFSAFEQLQHEIQSDVANLALNVRMEVRPADPGRCITLGPMPAPPSPPRRNAVGKRWAATTPAPAAAAKSTRPAACPRGSRRNKRLPRGAPRRPPPGAAADRPRPSTETGGAAICHKTDRGAWVSAQWHGRPEGYSMGYGTSSAAPG
jgi:preprotein translocase subunit SecA